MKCKNVKCKKDIADGSIFCPHCGWKQDGKKDEEKTKPCFHCLQTGECSAAIKHEIVISCEYCVKKSGVDIKSLYPHVPCGYCQGKGFHPLAEKQRQNNNQHRNQTGRQSQGQRRR